MFKKVALALLFAVGLATTAGAQVTPVAPVSPGWPYGYPTITIPTGGVLKLPDGTAAAPALTFTGDTDTGFYRTGSNTIGVAANGGLRILMDSTQLKLYGGLNLLWDTDGGGGIGAPSATRPGYVNIGGRTLTANTQPAINIAETWNDGAGGTVVFTGIKGNWTDSLSAAGSLLMDLQVGSASKFKVDKGGYVSTTAVSLASGGYLVFAGRSAWTSVASGRLSATDSGGTTFSRLNLGPETSAFPALSVTSATPPTLTVQAADGSSASNLSVSGTLNASAVGVHRLGGLYTSASGSSQSINAAYDYNGDDGEWALNYRGYQDGTTKFRNVYIYDGKGAMVGSFIGSTKATTLAGTLTVSGATITAPAYVVGATAGADCTSAANITSVKGIVTACSAPAATPEQLLQMIADLRAEIAALKARQ